MVRQAVRTAPPTGPPADPALAELRHAVDELAATTDQLGELMLEVAPPTLSDAAAADVLAPLCAHIGEDLDYGLAAATRYPATAGPARTDL
ncbi:hypothetical protein ABTY00_35225 [Streptomyces microflavus]|uniref:hypothetical protein n=1 Tax=Streptomyces microflavus TaxID=1919 RepID=UPI00332FC994